MVKLPPFLHAVPADPEVAPAAVSARGVGSVGGSVGVSSSSSGRVASVGTGFFFYGVIPS